jgi:hypothetical protein
MADRDDLEFTCSLIEQDWPRSNPARLSSLSPRRVDRVSAVFALLGPELLAAGPVPQR